MELSQSSPTHMQRLQRSPLYPDLSDHAKQILGSAFGSRLLLLSIWHNFLIFSPHNEPAWPGNEPRCVTLCIRKDWCVCAWHTYLQPLLAYTLLSSTFSLSPLAIITGSIHHLKRDANFRSECIFRTDYSSKHGRPSVFTAGRTCWGARHSSARDSVKGCTRN